MNDDEMLITYVDGEMDATERAAFERAMADDPELARRVAKQQVLRAQLREAFDRTLAEPVPPRLVAAVHTAPVGHGTADAPTGTSGRRRRRFATAPWFAMAASLVLGVFLGQRLLPLTGSGPQILTSNAGLVAGDDLSLVLSERLTAEQRPGDTVRVGVSFQSRAGEYCRTFVVRNDAAMAGLACRTKGAWLIRTLETDIETGEAEGALRQAGTVLPDSVRQAVEARIAGEPLDAAGEARARAEAWRSK